MLALQQAALALGYQAQGWRLALADLAGAGPLLAHVVFGGEDHFTVLLSTDEHFAYLADPTLGHMAMPLAEFALAFSGAVLKVSLPEAPPQAAGDAVVVSEEVPAEAVALETAAAPQVTDAAPEAGEVVVETPVTAQDPVANEPLTSQPAAEPVEDTLPVQEAALIVAETQTIYIDSAPEASPAGQPGPLDAAEMEQIRGRVIPLLAIVAVKVIKVAVVKAVPVVAKAARTTWAAGRVAANSLPGRGAICGATHHVVVSLGRSRPVTVRGVVTFAGIGAIGGAAGIPFRSSTVGAAVGGAASGLAELLLN